MSKIIVPGELVSGQKASVPNTYIEQDGIHSTVVGIVDEGEGRVIPLQGPYIPRMGDWVIGVVQDVRFPGCNVEIKSPYTGFLSNKMTRTEFKMGDVMGAKVENMDEAKNIDLSDARRLMGGEIIEISAMKVPRVIGKKNSMIDTITQITGSEVLVGRNGRIWIKGGNSALAARTILLIEREAHTKGLTDRVTEMLKSEMAHK